MKILKSVLLGVVLGYIVYGVAKLLQPTEPAILPDDDDDEFIDDFLDEEYIDVVAEHIPEAAKSSPAW